MTNFLYQNKVWRTADGQTLRLEEMEPRHRDNVIAFLRRRAAHLKFAYEYSLVTGPGPSGDAACDAFDSGLSELFQMSDEAWLEQTPLMRRLTKLQRKGRK